MIQSMRFGWFNGDRQVYYFAAFARRRVRAELIRGFIFGEDIDSVTMELLMPMLRSCWASEATWRSWALSQRFDAPLYYKETIADEHLINPEKQADHTLSAEFWPTTEEASNTKSC